MNASHTNFAGIFGTWMPLLTSLAILVTLPACGYSGDASAGEGFSEGSGADASETGELGTDSGATDGQGDGDGDPGPGDLMCLLDCGEGTCVLIDDLEYCECPEQTEWNPHECVACPVVTEAAHALELTVVAFTGQFLIQGAPAPVSEYDDANLWLENSGSGDRVLLGNTHDGTFAVRVTPGIYDLIYEVETPGAQLPHNHRARLDKLALFSSTTRNIDIDVGSRSGEILLNEIPPPVSEYDDARILFRDLQTGDEVEAGNTHDGSYAVQLVPGDYEIVYRVETPGELTPRNDGAAVESAKLVSGSVTQAIRLTSVPLYGNFMINGSPAPVSEYNDANIELYSFTDGVVRLGNTHDGSYVLQVIPASYTLVYRHETGQDVPRNQRAEFGELDVSDGGEAQIDIPMASLSGALTINGAAPPVSEYDDGVVHLLGADAEDIVPLGNTRDGSYAVQLIPGSYDAYYAQETAGGTVPYNKQARLPAVVDVDVAGGSVDLNVPAVEISGVFTIAEGQPPTSEYDDGRIYLRNSQTGDSLLLGSTHDGGYTAIVVPDEYEIFYVQETGGGVLPGNQNALLGSVLIDAPMSVNVDVPVTALNGQLVLTSGPAPMTASDGGQLYLRTLGDDSVLLGDSFSPSFAAKLVAGTYGVYYRSEASMTMPQNENGRFACVTVE